MPDHRPPASFTPFECLISRISVVGTCHLHTNLPIEIYCVHTLYGLLTPNTRIENNVLYFSFCAAELFGGYESVVYKLLPSREDSA